MIRAELAKLARHSVIYGVADVVPYLVNFLLLPVFTAFLSRADYGALSILLLFAVLTKILFRMGLDSGFFRIYYELDSDRDRKTLATTLFATALGVSAALFVLCVLLSRSIGGALLGDGATSGQAALWILLVAGDTVLNTFAFVPMNLFRIQERPRAFTVMTLVRSAVNIGLKVVLVVSGWGVDGVLWADVVASALFAIALSPTLARNLAFRFSTSMLREAAAFGLPKVPHGLAHQVLNLSDRKLIQVFATLPAAGLYHIGYMMGTGVKFFLAAFELAWSPWVYAQVGKPGAARTIGRIATYAALAVVAFALANAVLGRELLILMTEPEYHDAHPVIPVVVLAYVMQGLFALTSVGLGISKRTSYYPLMTFTAAGANVLLNVLWIPRFGILGAAWATVAGYGTMALMGVYFAHKHYPIPYEWSRLLRIAAAAALAYGLSRLAPSDLLGAVLVKSGALLVFPAALSLLGFFRPEEVDALRELWRGRG